MRGQDAIIAMRKGGKRPKIVFVNDYPDSTAQHWENPGAKLGEEWPADHATVCTHGDSLASLDLRFLVGLRVSITGHSESRTKALFELAKAAGAEAVAAGHFMPEQPLRAQSGWSKVWHKEMAHA